MKILRMIKHLILKLINLLSVILIAISILIMLTVVLSPSGKIPSINGYSMLRVITGSMEPNIPEGALIVVRQTDPASLQVGDIISFYSRDPALQGEVNTHRITAVKQEDGRYIYETKGDANNIADRYETREGDLVGKVIFTSIWLGKAVRLLSNPLIFLPLIVLPLMILLLGNLIRSIRLVKNIAKEEEEAEVRKAIEEIRQRQKKDDQKREV